MMPHSRVLLLISPSTDMMGCYRQARKLYWHNAFLRESWTIPTEPEAGVKHHCGSEDRWGMGWGCQ